MKHPPIKLISLYFWIIFGIPLTAYSDQPIPTSLKSTPASQQLKISASLTPDLTYPGEELRLQIDLRLPSGWFIYALERADDDAPPPSSLSTSSKILRPIGFPYESPATLKIEKSLDLTLLSHHKKAIFVQHLSVPKDLSPGVYSFPYSLRFQLCSPATCLPVEKRSETLRFVVKKGAPRPHYQNRPPIEFENISSSPPFLAEGIWTFIGLAVLMGAVSLITPCVFPMIPLTVSFFSKQSVGRQKETVRLATLFAMGIILTYTTSGILFAALFGAGSVLQIASNPWVNLFLFILFILFGLSLLNVFEFRLPSSIINRLDQKGRSLGTGLGVLLMGVTFTLTAFTCTVQFIGTLLVAAGSGSWGWPILGMLIFSTVFAAPFFLLALFPVLRGVPRRLPKDALKDLRNLLGIIELMVAFKFLSNVDLVWETYILSRSRVIWVWSILLGGITLYYFIQFISQKKWSGFHKLFFTTLCALLILSLYGTQGNRLGGMIDSLLPPMDQEAETDQRVSTHQYEKLKWHTQLKAAEADALMQKKSLFIYFTGKTCVNCRWMEQNILRHQDVFEALNKEFVQLRLYTDSGEDKDKNLQYQIDTFSTVSLPFYVITEKGNGSPRTHSGIFYTPEAFLKFLRGR